MLTHALCSQDLHFAVTCSQVIASSVQFYPPSLRVDALIILNQEMLNAAIVEDRPAPEKSKQVRFSYSSAAVIHHDFR